MQLLQKLICLQSKQPVPVKLVLEMNTGSEDGTIFQDRENEQRLYIAHKKGLVNTLLINQSA